jgi:protein TonB
MNLDFDPSDSLLRHRRSIDIFVCTIVISIILHLTASTLLLLPGRYSVPSAAPLFVDLQNMAVPVEAPLEEAQQPEAPPLPEPEPLPQANPETAKMEQAIESSLQKAAVTPEAVHESSIGLGMISGHFASFSQGETLKDEIRVYYFELMRRINEAWWTSGAVKGNFVESASVIIVISREGSVVGCELIESSGNREQDKALLESIRKTGPLPPLPQSFRQLTFNAPIRFVPPLRLMLPGSGRKISFPH